jgi:hypothetical protein
MSDFLKCECPHCGQRIEYPSDGIGEIVPCPSCEKPVTLTLAELPQSAEETRRQKKWDEWKAAHLRQAWRPPHFTMPILTDPLKLLPVFSDESLRAIEVKSSDWTKTYIVNLLDYTCTCPRCVEIHAGVPSRDFGRLCKHIIIALRRVELVAQLPPIARGIVDNFHWHSHSSYPKPFGVYPGRFAKDLNGNDIYITGKTFGGWISIFALTRRDGVNYYRYGFNVINRRWCRIMRSGAYNWRKPPIDESILY